MCIRDSNNSREDRRTFNSINTWLAPPFHTAATRKSSESIVWYHMYTHEQQWACLVPPVRPARGIWCTWYLSARGVTCAYFYRLLVPWFGNNNEAQSIPRKKSFCSEGKTASTRGTVWCKYNSLLGMLCWISGHKPQQTKQRTTTYQQQTRVFWRYKRLRSSDKRSEFTKKRDKRRNVIPGGYNMVRFLHDSVYWIDPDAPGSYTSTYSPDARRIHTPKVHTFCCMMPGTRTW